MFARISMRLAREERGFTLIELIIVTAMLGSLTSIALPSYLGFRERAGKAAASQNVANVAIDVERYSSANYAGADTAKDPDWNGVDAPGSGTNGDTGYDDTWVGAGHDLLSRLQAVYDPSIDTSAFHWDPAGWAPSAGLTTASDYCLYSVVGVYYAAKHGPQGAITSGTTLSLGADGTCTAS